MPELAFFTALNVPIGPHLWAMVLVAFAAGVIRGFTGFGSALLLVPALAVLYGPVEAVVIEILIEVPVSIGLLPLAVREAERKTVLPMLGMFVLFVPVGTLLLTVIDPDIVKIVISLFVLLAVALMAQQSRVAQMLSPRATYVAGAISGTSQGLTGMAGPVFATALLARGESAALTRANLTALAAGIVAISALSCWMFGLVNAKVVVYAGLATPAVLLGVWTGSVFFRRLSHWNLRVVILSFLALTALATLVQTLM